MTPETIRRITDATPITVIADNGGGVWWIRYYRGGRRFEESARTEKREVARALLKVREGDIAKGIPVSSRTGRYRFDDGAADITAEIRPPRVVYQRRRFI